MTRQLAIKLYVQIGPDHTIKLPDEVPEGPAEVIVFVPESKSSQATAPPEALGLFKDDADVVEDAMAQVRELRGRARMRSAP